MITFYNYKDQCLVNAFLRYLMLSWDVIRILCESNNLTESGYLTYWMFRPLSGCRVRNVIGKTDYATVTVTRVTSYSSLPVWSCDGECDRSKYVSSTHSL